MKRKFYAIAALALSMGLASCNNEEAIEGGKGELSGKDTYMQISISQPSAPDTYATTDPNSSEKESKFTTVDLYVYDMTANVLEVHKRLEANAFDGPGSGTRDKWTAKTKIPCKTGNKKVLAALNITEARGQAIANKGMNIFTESQFGVTNYGTTDEGLVDLDGRGIAMFSVGPVSATMYPESDATNYAANNKVTIPVQRLVSKVTLQKVENLVEEAGGGTISGLEYTLATTNLKTYLLRTWGAAGTGAVKDHNWDSFATTDFFAAYDPGTPNNIVNTLTNGDFVAMNAFGVATKDLVARYCPENTSKEFLQKEVTSAIVRCKYIPGTYKKYKNDTDKTEGYEDMTNSTATATTFYVVAQTGGVKQYFMDAAVADDYITDNGGTRLNYVNGYCYYRVYLNPKGTASKTTIAADNKTLDIAAKADGVVGPYDVIRNAFYQVTISKIVAPGNPTPEPLDPDQPVAVPTDITADIEIVNWDVVAQNEELTPM